MRVKVSGVVKIIDEEGHVFTYKNQIQSSFIQAIIQYAQVGGTVSNYAYSLQLLDSNGDILGDYTGALSYKQVSNVLEATFGFVTTAVPGGVSQLQLYVSSSLGTTLIAVANNVNLPVNSSLQVLWTISFTISPNDYFTPYLIFAFLAPPSQPGVFTPNVQTAYNEIVGGNYLTSPPSYYLSYGTTTIKLTPNFTQNSIQVAYDITNITSTTSIYNIQLYATGQITNVLLLSPIQQVTVQPGQVISVYYYATW